MKQSETTAKCSHEHTDPVLRNVSLLLRGIYKCAITTKNIVSRCFVHADCLHARTHTCEVQPSRNATATSEKELTYHHIVLALTTM
jgi:hypothetical protein